VWSFDVGAGINAPAITYSVNGKQYVAVLVGARVRDNILGDFPELKNVAVTHMLYVFGL
jgi:alcohol dehydrogenase (cytochrome c)